MAMDTDELEPRKKKPVLKDLHPLSVGDLEEYILGLQAEIERARAMILSKKAALSGAEAFFKR
ncbi:MAG: DUF1192 domain-containing protein [Rhodospirillaceae bacterium]